MVPQSWKAPHLTLRPQIKWPPLNFVLKVNMQIAEVQCYFIVKTVILASAVWSQHTWNRWQSSELTFKVINFCCCWKPTYDFLLVINCHLNSIFHHFWDIALWIRKPPHPTLSPENFITKFVNGPLKMTIKTSTHRQTQTTRETLLGPWMVCVCLNCIMCIWDSSLYMAATCAYSCQQLCCCISEFGPHNQLSHLLQCNSAVVVIHVSVGGDMVKHA